MDGEGCFSGVCGMVVGSPDLVARMDGDQHNLLQELRLFESDSHLSALTKWPPMQPLLSKLINYYVRNIATMTTHISI